MNHCAWYVQSNLSQGTEARVAEACTALGKTCVPFRMIPFVERMPRLRAQKPFVLLGSTTLNRVAAKSRTYRHGMFFNPRTLRPEQYLKNYGLFYFNHDMRVAKIKDVARDSFHPGEELFIRSNDDSKQIAGGTMLFRELLDIQRNTEAAFAGDLFTPDSEVCLATIKPIDEEWRLVIVEREVVGASRYRPSVQAEVPEEVKEFGREMASIWTPHDVFVLDVCSSQGELRVMECNCFNGSGFYDADMKAIISRVSDYQEKRAERP